MKKINYLLLATCFTAAVFANEEVNTANTKKSNSVESKEFVDVMPTALENVDLSDPETVVKTAINAFVACEVEVAAYLTYINPNNQNRKEIREKTTAGMLKGCKQVKKMVGDAKVKVLKVDYNEEKTEAQVSYQITEKNKTTDTLIKTDNGWRMK